MLVDPLDSQTRRSLEWEELTEYLASCAHSSLGASKCRNLLLETDISLARLRQQETTEMLAILDSAFPLPDLHFCDLNPLLIRVGKGARLEAPEFRDISSVIQVFQNVQKCLAIHSSEASILTNIVGGLENIAFVGMKIDGCVNREGEVLETASPILQSAIRESQGLKQQMRNRLEALIASERYRDLLQEPYFAQRQSRYVLPIKSDRKNAVPGIVHDESSSGATVFVEPRELIDLNNRIRVADLQVTREINRLLLELSELVASHSLTIRRHLEVLSTLDCIAAKARCSLVLKGQPVEIHPGGRIHLYHARHPLLFLARETIVPNDIFLEEDERVLVISGPNTGGKTVTLKLLGIFALMIRAGLHLPCGEGSVMGFFNRVFADVGDAQDLRKDLSSFSAHIKNLVNLFDSVRLTPKVGAHGYLVLLDEVMSSTDPAEGSALGEALLLELAREGFKVIVTTHYNALKVLALSTSGFKNASLEIQLPSFFPTYRLIQGFPGGSSAFDIASHLGLHPGLLEHARTLLNKEDRRFENLFAELQAIQDRLQKALQEASEKNEVTERARQDAKIILENLRHSEGEATKTFKKRFREALSSARHEIQETLEELRKEKNPEKAKQALKRLADVNKQVENQYKTSVQYIDLELLDAGDRVEIAGLETIGILLESPCGKKRVRIKVGESEISTATNVLRGIQKGNRQQIDTGRSNSTIKKVKRNQLPSVPSGSTDFFTAMTIDVRGRTADDALEHIVAMLDQAALKGFKGIQIIHGHGTGKLKQVIRNYLANSPYVLTARAGEEGEGRDGVTIVEMR